MAAQIKITQLTDIGSANIATTTVLPVVNMAGVATTQKTTLGNLANAILSQSGSNYARAANANIAYSVANAAQPNITSVGTLTTLTVSGNTNLGAVGNVKITGGTAGQILSTDGAGNLSWVSDANGGSYGNSNVSTFLASYGSNTITTTGNVSVGNIIGNGQALTGIAGANVTGTVANANYALHVDVNPTTNNFSYHIVMVANPGDNALQVDDDDHLQYNPADGTLTTYRLDANILNITNEVASNMIPFSNVTYDLGNNTNRWKDIYLANSTIYLGDATLSANGNSIVVDSITVTNGNVGTVGNIASLNLDGSGSNVLYGNGVFAPASGGNATLPLANGNSNFDIATVDGNATITANGTSTWTFGDDGLLTLPGGNTKIGLQYGSEAILASNTSFGVATQGNGTTFINWSDDVSNTSMLAAIYVNDPTGNAGNISIRTGSVGNANVWKFVTDGTVVFPTLTVDIHNGGNQQAQTLQFGDPNQQAIITGPTPAVDTNAQRLIIQGQRGNGTGEGGDVYFWAGDADTNGGDIKIYAGDADSGNGYGGYINIDAGNGPDSGGQLSLSGGYSANGQGGTVNIGAGQGGTDGGAVNINGGGAGANQGGNIALTGGYGGNNGGEVRLTGGSAGTGIPGYGNIVLISGASTWTFDNNGNLVLGGGSSVIQSIANSSLDPLNPNVSTMTLTPDANYNSQVLVLDPTAPGHIHLRAYASSNIDEPAANIFLGGENTAFEITQGANNVAKIHSGGNTWTFTNAGDLQLASGNSVISSLPNNAGDSSGLSTLNLYPDNSTGDDRYLIIDPTGPAHLHLRAGGAQDASNVLLYLGGEQTYVQVDDGYHRVSINSYDAGNATGYNWRFDFDGNLVLPGNTFAVKYANGTQVSLGGGSTPAGSNNQIQFNSNGAFGASGNYTFTDTVGGGTVTVGNELNLLGNGTIGTANGNLNIQPAGNVVVTTSIYSWVYNLDGTLSLPTSTYGYAQLYTTGANLYLGNSGNPINIQPDGTISSNANVSANVGLFNDLNLNNAGTNAFLYTDSNRNIYDTQFGYDSANDTMSGGNISLTGTISATNIGNISGINLDGNASNVLYGNGVFAAPTSGYGDSNVTTLLGSFGSNAISTTGNVSVGNIIGNGQSLTGIAGSNVTGQVSNSLVAGTVYTAAQPNITSVGTLTSLTVSGNVTAQGVGTNLVRRANTIGGSNTIVTLDNLTALVGGTPTRLFIGAATSNMTMAGTSQTMISGSIAVSSWINVPIVTGVGNGFAMSGAISSAGDTVVLNVTDQGAGSGTWRVTGMIANTSANLYSVSIERLA